MWSMRPSCICRGTVDSVIPLGGPYLWVIREWIAAEAIFRTITNSMDPKTTEYGSQ